MPKYEVRFWLKTDDDVWQERLDHAKEAGIDVLEDDFEPRGVGWYWIRYPDSQDVTGPFTDLNDLVSQIVEVLVEVAQKETREAQLVTDQLATLLVRLADPDDEL